MIISHSIAHALGARTTDSDIESNSFSKPPGLCWSYFNTLSGPPDKDSNPTVQSAKKRAHRKCSDCQEIPKSCTVVTGIAYLETCGKDKEKHPGMLSALEHNKLNKM